MVFPRSLTGCAAVATAGFGGTPVSDSTRYDVTPTVEPSGNQLGVTTRSWSTGANVSIGFNLIGIC